MTAFFEPMRKRRRGFPSETKVKRGYRVVRGYKELIRKTRPKRSMPMRLSEVVSRIVVSGLGGSTARTGKTTSDRRHD